MPSLRRSFSSPTVRPSPYPLSLSLSSSFSSPSSSSSAHPPQSPRQRRSPSDSATASRRVLADIEWWRVVDGQQTTRALVSESRNVNVNERVFGGSEAGSGDRRVGEVVETTTTVTPATTSNLNPSGAMRPVRSLSLLSVVAGLDGENGGDGAGTASGIGAGMSPLSALSPLSEYGTWNLISPISLVQSTEASTLAEPFAALNLSDARSMTMLPAMPMTPPRVSSLVRRWDSASGSHSRESSDDSEFFSSGEDSNSNFSSLQSSPEQQHLHRPTLEMRLQALQTLLALPFVEHSTSASEFEGVVSPSSVKLVGDGFDVVSGSYAGALMDEGEGEVKDEVEAWYGVPERHGVLGHESMPMSVVF